MLGTGPSGLMHSSTRLFCMPGNSSTIRLGVVCICLVDKQQEHVVWKVVYQACALSALPFCWSWFVLIFKLVSPGLPGSRGFVSVFGTKSGLQLWLSAAGMQLRSLPQNKWQVEGIYIA